MPPSRVTTPLPSWLHAGLAGAFVGSYLGFTSVVMGVHAVLLMAAILAVGLHRRAWRVVFALGVLPLVPLVALSSRSALDVFIVLPVCHWGPLFAEYEGLAMAACFLVPGSVSFLIGLFAAKRERHLPPRLLQVASLASLALAAVLLAVSAHRAIKTPDHEHYVESLPVLGVMAPAEGDPTKTRVGAEMPGAGYPSLYEPKSDPPERVITRIYDVALGDLHVRRLCPSFKHSCFVELRHIGQPFSLEIEGRFDRGPVFGSASWQCKPEEIWVSPGDAFVVREDAFHNLILLDGPTLYAVQRPKLDATGVHIGDVIDTTSPPRGLVASAALGVLVAAGVVLRATRARRRLAKLARARQGELDNNGWISFDDGSPSVRAGERGLPVGPVLLVGATSARAPDGPYRGEQLPPGVEVLAGERSEILADEREALGQSDVSALAIVLLTAAPLFMAARYWALW